MVMLDYLLRFIEEDAPNGDITSDAVIPEIICDAIIRAEQGGIIAGLEEASTLFSHFGVSVTHWQMTGIPFVRIVPSFHSKGMQKRFCSSKGPPSTSSEE